MKMISDLQMMFRFMALAYSTYRKATAGKGSVVYAALGVDGCPCCTILVGTGREAWRLSVVAIEAKEGIRAGLSV